MHRFLIILTLCLSLIGKTFAIEPVSPTPTTSYRYINEACRRVSVIPTQDVSNAPPEPSRTGPNAREDPPRREINRRDLHSNSSKIIAPRLQPPTQNTAAGPPVQLQARCLPARDPRGYVRSSIPLNDCLAWDAANERLIPATPSRRNGLVDGRCWGCRSNGGQGTGLEFAIICFCDNVQNTPLVQVGPYAQRRAARITFNDRDTIMADDNGRIVCPRAEGRNT
ncbi:hypothetical protein BDV25DRAFT_136608 [Aspergillus avenaceus]|uniref:Cyanovirin-N domain-containing protein n=1 Tax=Aspergillus avenaceus TaxID=36643 RepID=A0A5N6U511_ASPAV|nr:hypothetical protein BDV25DRAFT_136608 [Aspergillus avenaceus]